MKATIRKNVFETNSSSMHAIVMSASDGFEENGIPKIIEPRQYRKWTYEVLDTPFERLQYLWTAIDCLDDDDIATIDEWKKYLIENLKLPEETTFIREFDKDIYKEMSRDNVLYDNLHGLLEYVKGDETLDKKTVQDMVEKTIEDYYDNDYLLTDDDLWNDNLDCTGCLESWLKALHDDSQLLYDYVYGKDSRVYVTSDSNELTNLVEPDSKHYKAFELLEGPDDDFFINDKGEYEYGKYDEYEEWATKLQDVYMEEAQKITDAYMESAS